MDKPTGPCWYCPYCVTGINFDVQEGIALAGAPYCPLCNTGYLGGWEPGEPNEPARRAVVRYLQETDGLQVTYWGETPLIESPPFQPERGSEPVSAEHPSHHFMGIGTICTRCHQRRGTAAVKTVCFGAAVVPLISLAGRVRANLD